MSGSVNKSSGSKAPLSVQTIVLTEIGWALLALLFFMLFSTPSPAKGYLYGTQLEPLSLSRSRFFAASLLCYRNWRSPQIVSGRNVWLGIGLGTFCYFIGGLLFSYWELGLGLDPDVSAGDFFFILSYLFLGWGMVLAVVSRRLNLETWQWGVVVGIATVGFLIAWLTKEPAEVSQSPLVQPAIAAEVAHLPSTPSSSSIELFAQAVPTQRPTAQPTAPATRVSPKAPPASPRSSPAVVSPTQPAPAQPVEERTAAPAWAVQLDQTLKPLKSWVNLFYVGADITLLVIATTLLLAFWGGRFSQSWRMIAAAAFSLYIADIWFRYASRSPDYQSGSLPEVFWVFSGVLFGIGAALEFDISSRSRRSGSRRRA